MLGAMIATAGTLVVVDYLWQTANISTSSKMISAIQGQPLSIRWIPTVLVYVVMFGLIWMFAVRESKTVQEAATRGAALGFAVNAIYDLTNYATLVKYPVDFAVLDVVWGTALYAAAAAAGKAVL